MPSCLSIIIPLFNESERLPLLEAGIREFLEGSQLPFDTIEWVLVDDGSADETWAGLQALAQRFADQQPASRHSCVVVCHQLAKNRGKGAALRAGVLRAQGDWLLTMDADMATPPLTLQEWHSSGRWDPEDPNTIVVGSRMHPDSQVQDRISRRIMGRTFNLLTRLTFCPVGVSDSQCGYKLYPRALGRRLFEALQCEGWAHDVELLMRARLGGWPVKSGPVAWTCVEGSRIRPIRDALQMAKDVVRIRLRLLGERIWRGLRNPWVAATTTIFVFAAIFLGWSYPQHAVSIDEPVQQIYGEFCARWYLSGFHDHRSLSLSNMAYYGAAFEIWPGLFETQFPEADVYPFRKLLLGLVGILGLLGAYRLARLLTDSPRGGFFAVLLLALHPLVVGHQLMNSKDGPFAVGYLWCLYLLAKLMKELPAWSLSRILPLGGVLGLTLGIRFGGLLILPTLALGLAGALWLLVRQGRMTWRSALTQGIAILGIISTVAYGVMLLFWPAAQVHPISAPLRSLRAASDFPWDGPVRFRGELTMAADLPWYYAPHMLWVQTPEAVWIGLGLMLLFGWRTLPRISSTARLSLLVLACASLLPLALVAAGDAKLFDNARHMLFVLGPLTVLAAVGWWSAVPRSPGKALAATAGLGLLLVPPAISMARLHPYQYAYYNQTVGGPQGGYARYGADYWFLATWEALQRLEEHLAVHCDNAEPIAVYCPVPRSLVEHFSQSSPRLRPVRRIGDAQFAVMSTRADFDQTLPGKVVLQVERYGKAFSVVKDLGKPLPCSAQGTTQ